MANTPGATDSNGMGTDSRQTMEASSDHALLQRFRRGQSDAATVLYVRYAKRLNALARSKCSPALAHRVEPEDIVQSVFRSFFRKAADGLYDVPEGEDLWKLFLVITLNKIYAKSVFHHARKRDVRLTVNTADIDESALGRDEPDDQALAELQMVVEEILSRLSDLGRQMVELRIQGFEVAEIAQMTVRSKRTVERTLQQFRSDLRTLLEGIED
jgi:RNA polymerase sigma-70 factor, ECF subfamily